MSSQTELEILLKRLVTAYHSGDCQFELEALVAFLDERGSHERV